MSVQTQVSWVSLVEIGFGPSRNKVNRIATNLIEGNKYAIIDITPDYGRFGAIQGSLMPLGTRKSSSVIRNIGPEPSM
jgi:hypothetical protein